MNKQLFRLVFNQARGQLMAVAESASSHSRGDGSRRRRKLAFDAEPASFALNPLNLAIVLFVTGTIGLVDVAQAQIVGDPNAAGNLRPVIGSAGNGVPLIQIQTPSAAGVSRNVYSQFDVQNNGAILNNARNNTPSQLGGWIQGNANLAAGTARIILNEVNSSDPSALRGAIEVAGDKAQVVIANPAGITCDGCGFINANRATLTTGTPILNGGSLDGYRVERGQIVIQGTGLDATQADYTDLIARSVQVNTDLWANTLKITTGANQVNADNTQATPISGSGTAPAYAIDVAQLGGMYAGKIHLIGTEAGLGMRNAGTLGASVGEVAITVDGQLVNSGQIGAQGDVTVSARSLNNSGARIEAVGHIDLNLGSGNLDNTGGLLRSNGALSITADSVTNRSTQGTDQGIEGQSLALTANIIDNTQGALRADQAITILSSASLNNTQGLITSNQTISIADTAGTPTLAVTNTGGTLLAGQNLSLNLGTLSGDGNLYSLGDLDLRLNSDFTNSGRVVANNNLTLSTSGRLSNQSALQAGNTLTLTAADLDNTATGQITANATTLGISNTLTNRGLIDGSQTRLFVGTLNNLGSGRIFGDNLAISATTLNNDAESGSAPVIAARNRLDIGADTINNREGALLFSAGDLAIGGSLDLNSQAIGQAGTVNNTSASIEALGNLDIAAQTINNTNAHFSTTVDSSSVVIDEYQGSGSSTRYLVGTPDVYVFEDESLHLHTPENSYYETWYAYHYTRTTTDSRVLTSAPGQILAGGTMTLSGTSLINDKSQIIAGGALNATLGSLTNTDVTGEHTVTDTGSVTTYWRDFQKGRDSTGSSSTAYTPAPTIQSISLSPTRYQQNTAPTGSGTQIAALSSGNVGSTPTLPDNALFQQNPAPSASHLIESDPRFTNYRSWISSDYMLEQLSIDPTTAQKRLGDGFYEQKLLREAIAQLTGRRFLAGYASDEAEYRALMDNGVTQARAWQLIPGVALSAAQIAQLTSDIVWLVETDVTLADGSHQRVLAPQVYLAPRSGDLLPGGALLSADSLDLNLSGDLINAGTIAGRQIVKLAANNLHNLGTIRGDSVSLTAQTDLNNLGGRIEAVSSLALQAGRDITVASSTRTQTAAQGSRTHIDRVAGLYVTGSSGSLSAVAGRDLNLNGAELDTAGNSATTLAAGNNLSLGAVTESTRQSIVFDSRNHLDTASTSDTGTTIRTQGDLTLIAGHDLTATAADVQATGTVALSAGNDVSLFAGQRTETMDEATFHESKSKRPGLGYSIAKELAATGRSTSSSFKSEQSDVIASQITGQNVTIQSQRDTNLEATNLTAREQLKITAGNDLNIVSAEQTLSSSQTRIDKRSNTFGLGKKSLKETVDINRVEQVGSTLRGKAVDLIANNDLTVSASRVAGTDSMVLTAGNEISILTATNVDERQETREYRNSVLGIDTVLQPFQGKNGFQNSLGLVTPNSYVSPGRVKDKISSESSDHTRSAARSELSGGDIVLQSGRDTTLQAPVITGKSLAVTAGVIDGEVINPQARLKLEGVKESRTQSQSGSGHSFMWQSMAGIGASGESLKMPEILLIATVNPENRAKTTSEAPTKPALNATGGLVVDAVSLPGTAQDAKKTASPGDPATPPAMTVVDLKAQAQELAQQPGMAWLADLTKRNDVDWKTVQLVRDNWDYKHAGLTREGGIVVAIVVAIVTWGAASGVGASVTASTTTATGSAAVGAAAGAATTAAITTLASQAAVSLINNQGDVGKTLEDLSSDESIKQLQASMLTAGATAGVTSAFNLPNPAAANATFASRFTTYATQAMVGAGVRSLVYGQPLEESAQTALITALAQSLTSEIGDWGKEYKLDPGSAAKIVAHAVVQCAAASVQGYDCGSAALGGAIAEALSPLTDTADQSPLSQDLKLRGQLGNAISSMSALLAAKLTGSDTMTALGAAQTVDYYNRQLHPEEAKIIAARAKEYADKRGISTTQAVAELTQQAERNFDGEWDKRLGSDNQAAQAFLKDIGLGKTMVDPMTGQSYQLFTADAAQRDNHAMFAQYSKTNPLVKAELDLATNRVYLPKDAQNIEQRYQSGSDMALNDAARDYADMRTQPASVQQAVLVELRQTRLGIATQESALLQQLNALPLSPENRDQRAALQNQIDRLETRDGFLLTATQAQILDMGSVGLLNPLSQRETTEGFGDALGGARLSGKGVSSAYINGRINMLTGAIAETKAAVAADRVIAQAKVDNNFYRDGAILDFGSSKVITNPNEAFFWSGRTDGIGGIDAAKSIANQYKGQTLEHLLESRQITMPAYDPTIPSSVQAWQDISSELAKNASGEVRAVLGSQVRPKNIWETYELPVLMGNPAVTRIITIDPKTGVEHMIFQRGK